MSEPTLIVVDGAYRLSVSTPTLADRTSRWTAYARYSFSGRDVDADSDPSDLYVEEIDVDAPDYASAWRVAEAALARDYEPGGAIAARSRRGTACTSRLPIAPGVPERLATASLSAF